LTVVPVMAFALGGLWYHPLGFAGLEPIIAACVLAVPFLAGVGAGWFAPRVRAVAGAAAGTVGGLAVAWVITAVIDRRPEGELMLFGWLILATIAASGHLLGVVLRRELAVRRGIHA
jgi:hypothetical protein